MRGNDLGEIQRDLPDRGVRSWSLAGPAARRRPAESSPVRQRRVGHEGRQRGERTLDFGLGQQLFGLILALGVRSGHAGPTGVEEAFLRGHAGHGGVFRRRRQSQRQRPSAAENRQEQKGEVFRGKRFHVCLQKVLGTEYSVLSAQRSKL